MAFRLVERAATTSPDASSRFRLVERDGKSTALSALGRGAAESVLPSAAGLGAAAALTPLATAAAPATFGLSYVAPIAAGLGAGFAASQAQRRLVPKSIQRRVFLRPEDVQAHPIAATVGQFIPSTLALRPGIPKTFPQLRTALASGAIQGGIETGIEAAQGEGLNPARIATSTVLGGALTRPTRIGQRLLPGMRQVGISNGRQKPQPITGPTPADLALRGTVSTTRQKLQQVADQLDTLTQTAKVVLPEAETIASTGTTAEATRPILRETGRTPDTTRFQFSQEAIEQSQRTLTGLSREIAQLHDRMVSVGDPLSSATTLLVRQRLQQTVGQFNREAAQFRKLRFAAGRSVKTFDRPPVSQELTAALRESGALLDGLTNVKARLPLYTNIMRSFRRFPSLTPAERGQLGKDLVDAWRLNLFSVTSWTLDLVGNATELSSQFSEAAGRDLGHAMQGRLTFPNLGAFFRALRRSPAPLPTEIAAGVGENIVPEAGLVSGGFGKGRGTFTTREGAASTAVDYLAGSPLYLKGVTDTAARRYGATVSLWQSALESADAVRLRGADRQGFLREFWANPSEGAIARAVEQGNKAGFNRQLTNWEKAYTGHPLTKLIFDPFARWPLQFGRAMVEWLGWNRPLFQSVIEGRASLPAVTGYLTKAATGWGGVWLIDQLYDGVDFRSMEYVKDDGSRVRLSGREPIPTVLWLLATIKGDVAKSAGALQYASVPFGRFISPDGGGGLLGSTVRLLQMTAENGRVDPRGVRRELDDTINRMVPGQAVLSALKTVFDPTIREGIGANLPGLSLTKPAAIDPTTGHPLRPQQRVLGSPAFPSIGGTPIPGAERVTDPVQRLLSQFGMLVYRGPRSPIAGIPPTDLPEKFRREWVQNLGRHRQELLLPIAQNRARLDQTRRDPTVYEQVRKQIQALDKIAGQRATQDLIATYGLQAARGPRRLTLRERQGPTKFRPPIRTQ